MGVVYIKNSLVKRKRRLKMGLDELGEVGIKVLLFLYKKGTESNMGEIVRLAGVGWSGLYRVYPVLLKYGLIRERQKGKVRFWGLTDFGRKIAEEILKIEKMLTVRTQK